MPVALGRRPAVTVGRVGSCDVEHLLTGIVRTHRLAALERSRLVVWGGVTVDDWLGDQPGGGHAGGAVGGRHIGISDTSLATHWGILYALPWSGLESRLVHSFTKSNLASSLRLSDPTLSHSLRLSITCYLLYSPLTSWDMSLRFAVLGLA